MLRRTLFAVVILLFATRGNADDPRLFRDPSFDVAVTRDIAYATAAVRAPSPGRKKLLLDVYEPKGKALPPLRPAVITFHGGGFKTGDKSSAESMADVCHELASRGFVCVSVDYRLEPDDPATPGESANERAVTAAVEDAASAMRWVRRKAAEMHIDPSRIALAGRSAGAVAVLRLAYSETGRRLHVRAVVEMSGSMNGQEASMKSGDAPLCIIHGINDSLVPVAEAEALARRAAEAGVPHVIYLLEGKGNGHVRSFSREVEGVTLLERTIEFLYAFLDLSHVKPVAKQSAAALLRRGLH